MMNERFKSSISKEEINRLPLLQFDNDLFLIDHKEQLFPLAPILLNTTVLGFDTETRPSFKKGKINQVALLQLATATQAFLIRVKMTGLPNQLISIFENPAIIKAGVAIRDDIKSLQKIRHFEPKGFIDLQQFTQSYGIEDNSLKKLTAIILNQRISKSERLTNWDNKILTRKQKRYAATDAWVCYEIYTTLTADE
jgi:ribonuclease D